MTKEKRAGRTPLKAITAIVAVIVVILFVTAGMRISDYAKGSTYEYDARDYLYPAEGGRFGDLYDTTIRDMGKHVTYSPEIAECRALAFYYEQAVLEHAYRATGDDAKAGEFAERMAEYESQLGSLASKAAVVREQVSTLS